MHKVLKKKKVSRRFSSRFKAAEKKKPETVPFQSVSPVQSRVHLYILYVCMYSNRVTN